MITDNVLRQLTHVLDVEVPKAVVGALRVVNMESRQMPVKAAPQVPKAGSKLVPDAKVDGKCAAIRHELDRLRAAGKEPTLEEVKRIGARKRWNPHTTRIQFYRWKSGVN